MKPLRKLMVGAFFMVTIFSFRAFGMDEAAAEKLRQFGEQREAIYDHMKRYGINREDVAALRRLYEISPPHSRPHVNLPSEKLLNPGEHYRIEMDEYILTMKVPEGAPVPGNWIWPYTNIRHPTPEMEKLLKQSNGALKVADLGWYACNSILPAVLSGGCREISGASMNYRILKPEEKDSFSTPEKLRELSQQIIRNLLPTQAKIEQAIQDKAIVSRPLYGIFLDSRIVRINGRIWVFNAMDNSDGKLSYSYATALSPDRMLGITFGLPKYDYRANPDPSTYPDPIKKAWARMEEMVTSLRIAKINDDGSPDPFVIERVEPAPLPVRETLPAVQ